MPTVALISLGCPKNLVDSELILGRLAEDGYEITTDEGRAEIIIVNTCGFIGPAKEEAVQAILRAAEHKKTGRCRLLAAAGCLVQRYADELPRKLPEVDLWVTRAHYARISTLLERTLKESPLSVLGQPEMDHDASWPRLRSTPPHRAYLRIADGCDNNCRYCVIPSVRGSYHSRPLDDLLAEAGFLARAGVAEITLIAQDTTAYGHDLPGRPSLADLLRSLLGVEGPRWWRLLYTYPAKIDGDLIDLFAREARLCQYLDLPLQHIAPNVLRGMGRPHDPDAVRGLLDRLRARLPGLALRTTLMAGFPGETEADFEQLRAFVAEQRFNWLGVFAYSREDNTPAAALPGQIPRRVKEERRNELLRLQQGISRQILAGRVGGIYPVLVEGEHPRRRGYLLARSESEAPEIDGCIHLRSDVHGAGDFLPARVVRTGTYDLEAVPAGPPESRSL